MCGIVGVVSASPVIDKQSIVSMRDSMRHRGPDDAGAWWSPDRRVVLAHRRLAIIDLSSSGHQPMVDELGHLVVVFNGEVYNYRELRSELEARGHRFHTSSDTEIVLEGYRAWGLNCVSRFNGMFGLSIFDTRNRRLFLARDRAGEKPLFYYHASGTLSFASELKALMADPAFPRELDVEALNYYLTYGYAPGSMCMLKGVRKLPQGHAMTYDLDTDCLRVWRYWDLPRLSTQGPMDEEALVDELEALIADSVRLRLAADVPVGIMLSGGIDSSLVTAAAARASSKPVKTFTISFPGYGAYDEAPHARLVAGHFGTEHTELVAEAGSVDLLPGLARQYDEPMADSSMVPTYLVSQLIRQHATVALGGDGGDELFGGYPHHSWIQQQEWSRAFVPGPIRGAARAAVSKLLPVGMKGRNYLIGLASDLPQTIAHINTFFDLGMRQRLLSPISIEDGSYPISAPESFKATMCLEYDSPLQKATSVDFRSYLVDDILVKVDRASMLASLEVRAPWLDHRIIEFAFGHVPDSLKATKTQRKVLLRRLAERLLPPELDLTRKQGFSLPLNSWFKGDWGDYMISVLREADPGLFDRQTIQRLIAGQRKGYSNTNRLFALTMFELWRRHYRVAIPAKL